MKKITLSLIAACSLTTAFSQVVLQENFTAPFNPATAGWVIQNNSVPQGTISWTQGNNTGGNGTLVAFNGSTNDFYMADFLSIPIGSAGTISAFLITPPVTIYNGAVLQFATSTFSNATVFPDRLQVLMSLVPSPTIPAGATSVGPFTTTLLDINPLLSNSTSSAVSNGSVNGYPQQWTVYTLPISGVSGTVTGRFAFRYFVTNGGSAGTNSRLVGVDAVNYTLPCGPTVQSFTTCAGSTTTLSAMNGLAATTYSWSNSATSSSIAVNPNATTVYTLYPSANGLSCNNPQTATITVSANNTMNVAINSSTNTICSGNSITLTAIAPASNYAWGTVGGATPIGTNSVIVVSPTANTSYTVGALSGLCVGSNTVNITVNASPNLSVAISPACIGGSFTILASGATSYTYLASTANPQTVSTPTTAGGYNFGLAGTATNGCVAAGLVNFTVFPAATITAVPSKTIVCVGQTVTVNAAGAASYTWSGAVTSTANPVSYTAALPAGNKTFNVTGTDINGCTATIAKTVSVSACTGIETLSGNGEAAVYPNPFSNELKVTGISGNVEIYNSLGQLILATKVSDAGTINTSDFSKGAYILKAFNNDGQLEKTIKMLKN